MKTDLSGKVALVTGASRGIGAGIAMVLAQHGADVAVNYVRAKDRAEIICQRIRDLGRNAHPFQADVTDREAIRQMVKDINKALGAIDILVNNAGHNPIHKILEMNETDWDWVLDLNLKSYFLCSQAVLPDMIKQRDGRIINITSISGQRGGLACDVDYSAAKAGIMGFTRSLSRWAAPQGVLVNAVSPGYIETEHLIEIVPPERIAQLVEGVVLKRLGTSEEVGEAVAFLAGPGGSYIVGEVISVNGGVHIA
jgi:3-oxoacyl-[acyl-carrier protein] reductase